MAGPIYYFPGFLDSIIDPAKVLTIAKACGLDSILGDVITDGKIDYQVCRAGPDGTTGGLFMAVEVDAPAKKPNVGYYPDSQEWVFIKPNNYWLGFQTNSKPGPLDLQRNCKLLQDYLITLADGNDWAVMAIRPFGRQGAMPRIGKMDPEDFNWTWAPHPRFEGLLKRYEKVFAGDKDTMGGWADLAVDTLATNYRITKFMAMSLGLIEASHCEKIIDLAMDMPEFKAQEEAKKRGIERSDVSLSSYGEVVQPASPIIDQPTATSTG